MNVKPKDADMDVAEVDDPVEKAPHSQADVDEPRVAEQQEETKEKAKGVILKKADDPAVKERADAVLGEKAPHSPVGRKAFEEAYVEEVDDDPYAKAPHGDTDEEDRQAELKSLGGLRHSSEVRSDRSDRAACDEEERRSVPSSSLAVKERKMKRKTQKAVESRSVLSEEPTKRRKKKSKLGSKKAARKGHRQPSQSSLSLSLSLSLSPSLSLSLPPSLSLSASGSVWHPSFAQSDTMSVPQQHRVA